MRDATVLRASFEGTNWRRAFADSLLSIFPDMNPDAADEASDLEFLLGQGVNPKLAAKRWAERRRKLNELPGSNQSVG